MIRNFWNFHRKTESSAQVRNLGQQFWQWKVPSLLVARQTWEIRWICQIFPIIPLDRRIFQHWNECLEDHWDGYCEWFSVVASAWVSGRVFQRAWFRVSDLDVPLSASQTSTWYIFNTFRAQRHPATATATWNTAPLGPGQRQMGKPCSALRFFLLITSQPPQSGHPRTTSLETSDMPNEGQ